MMDDITNVDNVFAVVYKANQIVRRISKEIKGIPFVAQVYAKFDRDFCITDSEYWKADCIGYITIVIGMDIMNFYADREYKELQFKVDIRKESVRDIVSKILNDFNEVCEKEKEREKKLCSLWSQNI